MEVVPVAAVVRSPVLTFPDPRRMIWPWMRVNVGVWDAPSV